MRINHVFNTSGGTITLEQVDFGLYTVSFRGKVLREFHDIIVAKVYFDAAISHALRHQSRRKAA